MDKLFQAPALPSIPYIIRQLCGGHTKGRWYVISSGSRVDQANGCQMDGVVTSVIRAGFFVDCGSLQAFVGRNVRSASREIALSVH